jgi:hypothetical protein
MKISLPILALVLLTFFRASAQVDVQVVQDQDQFLPSESVPLAVRITNRSGQTLHLGDDAGWLTFSVESADGFIVMKNSEVPVLGAFDLGSSQIATKRVDLQPYFELKRQGRYRVIATLHIKAWNTDTSSPMKEFDVISGAELWSQEFGVPIPADATNRAPEVRKYTLEEANYLRSQLRMYVMVSDQSGGRVFKVSAIGPMVSFSQPEEQVDQLSNLHLIYQSGARTFTYSEINPDGVIVRQEIYDYLDKRPRLGVNAAGDVLVVGGVLRVRPTELSVVKLPEVKLPDVKLPQAKLPDQTPPPATP